MYQKKFYDSWFILKSRVNKSVKLIMSLYQQSYVTLQYYNSA